jgi:hypothetical protein
MRTQTRYRALGLSALTALSAFLAWRGVGLWTSILACAGAAIACELWLRRRARAKRLHETSFNTSLPSRVDRQMDDTLVGDWTIDEARLKQLNDPLNDSGTQPGPSHPLSGSATAPRSGTRQPKSVRSVTLGRPSLSKSMTAVTPDPVAMGVSAPRTARAGSRNVPSPDRRSTAHDFVARVIDSRRDRRVGSPHAACGPDRLAGSSGAPSARVSDGGEPCPTTPAGVSSGSSSPIPTGGGWRSGGIGWDGRSCVRLPPS